MLEKPDSTACPVHPRPATRSGRERAPRTPIDISVVGTGYVGLVTAACLAEMGHNVSALDVDAQRIERLERAELPFHEEGLAALVRTHVASGRLRFAGPHADAFQHAAIIFVAVGTPALADGSTDTSAVDGVLNDMRDHARWPTVIVMKSTVPVGTARRIEAALAESCSAEEAPRVLSNPEFLREGCAVEDFMRPHRIIVGDDRPADDRARRLLAQVYAPLTEAGVPLLTMDTRSAELSKYASNAMLAMRISFINEVAGIAAATGADIDQVSAGMGSDPRIGPHFLRPGLGFGGSCFPKDLAALRETARRHALRSDILLATQRINKRQNCWAFDALSKDLGSRQELRGLRVALWGLAFKPGTDDTREAPSLALLSRLSRAGALVTAYDPVAIPNARAAMGNTPHLSWADSAAEALRGADVLLLATEWPEFATFDPRRVASALTLASVYDGRNALDAAAWSAAGLRVVQVGRAAPVRRRPRAAGPVEFTVSISAPQPPAWSAVETAP